MLGESMEALFFPTRCVELGIVATKEGFHDAFIFPSMGRETLADRRHEKNASQALNFMHRALFSGSSSSCPRNSRTARGTPRPACAQVERATLPTCMSGRTPE